jgi:hypothetical protein
LTDLPGFLTDLPPFLTDLPPPVTESQGSSGILADLDGRSAASGTPLLKQAFEPSVRPARPMNVAAGGDEIWPADDETKHEIMRKQGRDS